MLERFIFDYRASAVYCLSLYRGNIGLKDCILTKHVYIRKIITTISSNISVILCIQEIMIHFKKMKNNSWDISKIYF